MILNLIQDVATPHNNVLIDELLKIEDIKLRSWYAVREDSSYYQWSESLLTKQDVVYGKNLNLSFILRCVRSKDEKFLLVGWANINTAFLHVLFFLLRRPYNHWTDNPIVNDNDNRKKRLSRWLSYKVLRYSKVKIFAVGKTAIERFKNWGFPDEMVVNLPIFVDVDLDLSKYRQDKEKIWKRYGMHSESVLLTAGSRLIYEKGYDLLINAIADIPIDQRKNLKLVLVGSGIELNCLLGLIDKHGLKKTVVIEDWMDPYDFQTLIANSDFFVHPARFDAYGSTVVAMALGTPVVGSNYAGAAVDRIEHDSNGFFYDGLDTLELSKLILKILKNPQLSIAMGINAHNTSLKWHPNVGPKIIQDNAI